MACDLRLAWASYESAKYAVEHWHYSQSMPSGKLMKVGVWEDNKFIGVVLYGRGATPNIGKPYGLSQVQVCELVRVALCKHSTPTSKVLALSLRMLRVANPGLRLVVSYADSSQGHHGGIYQACGWIYTGSKEYHVLRIHGVDVHPRTVYARFGRGGQSVTWLRKHVDPLAERRDSGLKHKYVMPLDADMRSRMMALAKPYPKRNTRSIAS